MPLVLRARLYTFPTNNHKNKSFSQILALKRNVKRPWTLPMQSGARPLRSFTHFPNENTTFSPQTAPRSQDRTKTAQDCPKIAPRPFRYRPKTAQDRPETAQDCRSIWADTAQERFQAKLYYEPTTHFCLEPFLGVQTCDGMRTPSEDGGGWSVVLSHCCCYCHCYCYWFEGVAKSRTTLSIDRPRRCC